ncbi:MAG: SDR family oxidoreductase [Methylohalobius sp. ZOD2]
MPTVLVTGANRGIGLEFVRQYLQAGWRVLACCRRPREARDLQALTNRFDALHIHPLDISDFERIDQLAADLRAEPIDLLINNAGIYGDVRGRGFGKLDHRKWQEVFRVNVQGTVKMCEAFLPHVVASDRKLMVALSSKMGSIADNSSGGSILYRSSKAALNMAMKSISIDLRPQGVGVLIFHPGWVETDMGGSNALISPEESVRGMNRQIEGFTLEDSGRFVDYSGKNVPW